MNQDLLPVASRNEVPYCASRNHTVEFAKLSREYVELHDRWEILISDAERSEAEAGRKREAAEKVLEKIEPAAQKLRDHIRKGS